MRWADRESKKARILLDQLVRANVTSFRRRADLLNLHLKHPGALATHFLLQAHAKSRQTPTAVQELSSVDISSWIMTSPEFREVREQREVLLLVEVLAEFGAGHSQTAIDLIVQRIRDVRLAKMTGQS